MTALPDLEEEKNMSISYTQLAIMFAILVVSVLALIMVWRRETMPVLGKIVWTLVILLLPVFGMVCWYLWYGMSLLFDRKSA